MVFRLSKFVFMKVNHQKNEIILKLARPTSFLASKSVFLKYSLDMFIRFF